MTPKIPENRLWVCPSGACSCRRLLCTRGVAQLLETVDRARFCTDASLRHSLPTPTHFCFLYRLRGNWLERLRSVRNNWALQYCTLRSGRSGGRQFAEEIRMNRCTSTSPTLPVSASNEWANRVPWMCRRAGAVDRGGIQRWDEKGHFI